MRPILTVPHPMLKQVSAPVRAVDDATRALMDEMLASMYAAGGIGLAAVQIGVPQRIVVMDLARNDEGEDGAAPKREPRYFVNPELTWVSEELANYAEGCLSVPEFFEDVERPARCRIRFLDYDGKPQEEECKGLLATCIQHEIDHLNGIVFLDHLTRLKRTRIIKKLNKQDNAPPPGAAAPRAAAPRAPARAAVL